jgi:hypothetical protein
MHRVTPISTAATRRVPGRAPMQDVRAIIIGPLP